MLSSPYALIVQYVGINGVAVWRWCGPLWSPVVDRLETSACRCTVSVPNHPRATMKARPSTLHRPRPYGVDELILRVMRFGFPWLSSLSTTSVILSEAKNLAHSAEMLRYAQHDTSLP